MSAYRAQKRLDEIIAYGEDEGWDGPAPRIAVMLRDEGAKQRFLRKTFIKLDNMGMDESDLTVRATSLPELMKGAGAVWQGPGETRKRATLFP